ncbi:hypothetical protein JCM9279_007733 [Rhodotorula babjevae]
MSAVYSIFTSPHHPPVPDHLPTLVVTPHGRPQQVLYTFLHTNVNTENYLLTPAPEGDLCVAKLYPPDSSGSLRGAGGSGGASSSGHGAAAAPSVRCEAGRGLGWRVVQTGIQNPVYKILLPNPDMPGEDQPLFQVSKPNPNATFWTLTYFAYAGHLIPPKRVEFGRISKNGPEQGGGTRLAITGRNDEEKAVWASLGSGNEDAVEWLVVCAALVVLDDEIVFAAAGAGAKMRSRPPSPTKRAAGAGAMRVVAPVEMQSGVPRSASSSNLVPSAAAPAPVVVSRGPSPNGPPHPDPRFMPPPPSPHGPPQQQQRMSPPHPHQQQQQQQYYQQQPHPSRPPPSSSQPPSSRSYAPPPRTSSVPPLPHGHSYAQGPPPPMPMPGRGPQQGQGQGQGRQPSGYRPGARPGPPMQPHPHQQAQAPQHAQVKESDGQRRLVKERHR